MVSTEKGKGEQWSCWLQKQPVQLLSELPGGNSHLCWKELSPPYCYSVLRMGKDAGLEAAAVNVLISSAECDIVSEGAVLKAAVMCAVDR